jgi:lipid-binding SYLF domain-containing protein
MKQRAVLGLFIISLLVLSVIPLYAGWNPSKPDTSGDQGVKNDPVAKTIANFKYYDPGLKVFFEQAYGYAVFPSITKGGLFFGGAYGEGKVYEKTALIGTSSLTQVTVGLQIGGQTYSEIIFFKDKKALDSFTGGNLEFGAQMSAIAVTAGVSTDVDYSNGVAVFTLPKGGLMAEAAIGGQKFSFEPVAKQK